MQRHKLTVASSVSGKNICNRHTPALYCSSAEVVDSLQGNLTTQLLLVGSLVFLYAIVGTIIICSIKFLDSCIILTILSKDRNNTQLIKIKIHIFIPLQVTMSKPYCALLST